MTSRDFCFWLQGFLELGAAETPGVNTMAGLNGFQVECVKRHLALVFKHEIDPSMGPPKQQAALDGIHGGGHAGGGGGMSGGGGMFRC
jgi:hypothetical protein